MSLNRSLSLNLWSLNQGSTVFCNQGWVKSNDYVITKHLPNLLVGFDYRVVEWGPKNPKS